MFGLFSKRIPRPVTTTYLFFTGLLNSFLLGMTLFICYPCFDLVSPRQTAIYVMCPTDLIPTGLLICLENTFWDINEDSNFVELFKKSFTLYAGSGMREMTERDIDILRNKRGEFSAQAAGRRFQCKVLQIYF